MISMKAMILAAGFGTRLKPLTDEIPKALVPYKGIAMIDHQIKWLKDSGFDEIVVNAFHHKDKMISYFAQMEFGIPVSLILEEVILGTGGGILNAESLLAGEKFFMVVNADIDFKINLRNIISKHESSDPLATLAVQKRKSGRYLEFDGDMNLIGRQNDNSKTERLFAFNGIHIISGRIFGLGYEKKFSDIIDIYLSTIQTGREFVKGFDTGDTTFKDLGKIENLT